MKKKKVRKKIRRPGKESEKSFDDKTSLPKWSIKEKTIWTSYFFFLYTYSTVHIIFIFLFLSHNQSITFITSFSLFFSLSIYIHSYGVYAKHFSLNICVFEERVCEARIKINQKKNRERRKKWKKNTIITKVS